MTATMSMTAAEVAAAAADGAALRTDLVMREFAVDTPYGRMSGLRSGRGARADDAAADGTATVGEPGRDCR